MLLSLMVGFKEKYSDYNYKNLRREVITWDYLKVFLKSQGLNNR